MKGIDKVLKNFDSLITNFEAVLELAVKSGALVIQNSAKVKAPWKTGHLKRSISTYIKKQTPEEVVAVIGTNVEYAKYQEYGTSKMKAQPYLRPAFDENIDKARKVMAKVFEQVLKRVRG